MGLAARIIWGIMGPQYARFSDMWHPAAWVNAVRWRKFQVNPRAGHHILASGVYLVIYLLLIAMVITGLGLAAIEQNMGPLNSWLGDMP